MQVVLNETHAQVGNPSVHPARTSSSNGYPHSGRDAPLRFSTAELDAQRTSSQVNSHSADTTRRLKHHSPLADSGGSDVNTDVSKEASERLFSNNIVPAALSELDVRRLAWAVKKVREIVSIMAKQGSVGEEVSPGAWLQEVDVGGAGQQGGNGVEDGLQTWVSDNCSTLLYKSFPSTMSQQSLITVSVLKVRNNAFMQSNWVGTAAMGSIAVTPPASEPNDPPIINAAPFGADGKSASSVATDHTTARQGLAGSVMDLRESPQAVTNMRKAELSGHVGSFRPDSVNDDGDDVTVDDTVEVLRSASVVDEELRVRNVISLRVAGELDLLLQTSCSEH